VTWDPTSDWIANNAKTPLGPGHDSAERTPIRKQGKRLAPNQQAANRAVGKLGKMLRQVWRNGLIM